jgi:hypothetical protein
MSFSSTLLHWVRPGITDAGVGKGTTIVVQDFQKDYLNKENNRLLPT